MAAFTKQHSVDAATGLERRLVHVPNSHHGQCQFPQNFNQRQAYVRDEVGNTIHSKGGGAVLEISPQDFDIAAQIKDYCLRDGLP
jgi:hypothetical protein